MEDAERAEIAAGSAASYVVSTTFPMFCLL
jgi:hypothetical protein